MKSPKIINRILALLLVAMCAILAACEAPQTPEQAARRARALAIGDRLLAYGERKGIVTSEDAAFFRETGAIAVPTKVEAKEPPPAIDTTSGK